jgi:hypothetical protein
MYIVAEDLIPAKIARSVLFYTLACQLLGGAVPTPASGEIAPDTSAVVSDRIG